MPFRLAYLTVLVVVLVAVLRTAHWVRRHRNGPETRTFLVLSILIAYWVFGFTLQAATSSTHFKFLAFHLWVPVAWLAPLTWFVFTVRYTGREYWLTSRVRALLGTWAVLVTGLSVTNPWHRLLWRDFQLRTDPFPVLDAVRTPIHDLILATSYVFVLAGVFLLAILFVRTRRSVARQAGLLLVGSGALLIAHVTFMTQVDGAIELNPTPATAGIFSLLVARALFRHRLFAVQPFARDVVLSEISDGVVILDAEGPLSDFNGRAKAFFPDISEGIGEHLSTSHPELFDGTAAVSSNDSRTDRSGTVPLPFVDRVRLERGDDDRTVAVEVSPLTTAAVVRGYVLILRDVTEHERLIERLESQNTKLEAKNEQLERLAHVISHDLQTPLSTAEKLLTLLRLDLADPGPDVDQSLEDMETVHRRLREFAEHMPKLARESTDVDRPVECTLEDVARAAWDVVETGSLELELEGDRLLEGDPRRLQQVFENLYRNVVEHAVGDEMQVGTGSSSVPPSSTPTSGDDGRESPSSHPGRTASTVRVGASEKGFYVADDGPGIVPEQEEELFEYGVGTKGSSGFGLAIVRTIVEAHEWDISVTESRSGGARFEIVTENA